MILDLDDILESDLYADAGEMICKRIDSDCILHGLTPIITKVYLRSVFLDLDEDVKERFNYLYHDDIVEAAELYPVLSFLQKSNESDKDVDHIISIGLRYITAASSAHNPYLGDVYKEYCDLITTHLKV